MPVDIVIPSLGESINEIRLGQWIKQDAEKALLKLGAQAKAFRYLQFLSMMTMVQKSIWTLARLSAAR